MFTTFRTHSGYVILDYGYLTNNHPKFKKQESAQRYADSAAKDPAKVARAEAVRAEADAFRRSLGLPVLGPNCLV